MVMMDGYFRKSSSLKRKKEKRKNQPLGMIYFLWQNKVLELIK